MPPQALLAQEKLANFQPAALSGYEMLANFVKLDKLANIFRCRLRPIASLVGFSRSESPSRAFKKRYGTRPTTYREFLGRLSPEVAADAGADRPPALPRYLTGIATLAAGTLCGRCGDQLEAGTASRVFKDLVPICHRCAREQAPELAAISDAGKGG